MRTHYDVLGVEPTATTAEIKSAHRRLASLFHPDRVGDLNAGAAREAQRLMGEANAAYDVLGSERKRAEYDATLDDSGRKAEAMANAASAFAQAAAQQEASQRAAQSAPVREAQPQVEVDMRSYMQLLKVALNDAARKTEREATMPGLTQMVFDRSLALAPSVAQEVALLDVTPSEVLYVVGLETLARSCSAMFQGHVGPLTPEQVYQLEVSRLAHVKMGQALRPDLLSRLNTHPQLLEPERKGFLARLPRQGSAAALMAVMIVVLVILSYLGFRSILG